MEAHDEEIGPIDIVVIGFPADAPMTGEAVPLLVDLVERGIVRVLDVLFVMANEDGTFSGFEATDLDDKGVGDLKFFEGASSGLLGEDDVAAAADAIEPGERGGHDRLREPLGGAVRRRRAPQRRRAHRQPAHSGPGPGPRSRRRRSAQPERKDQPCLVCFVEWPGPPSSPEPRRQSRTE